MPEDIVPIKDYVERCISSLSEEAVIRLGLQSGYLNIPENIIKNPSSFLTLDKVGIVKLPYWYYNGENRTPSLESMESEISGYVEENLLGCIEDFEAFRSGYEIEAGNISVTTKIADRDVVVEVNYPLVIKSKVDLKKTELKNFIVKIPVALKKAYLLANLIMNTENRAMFLENITIDLMAAHPDIPFTGMELSCKPRKWYVRKIKEELQSVLYYNLPRIRIENTDYLPFIGQKAEYEKFRRYTMEDINEGRFPKETPPEDAFEYFQFLINVGNLDKNLKAAIIYNPDWGMNIDVKPSDYGIMRSNMVRGASRYLSFLCVNIYHFTYDIAYPVEVVIKDEKSLDGRGYTFRFAFPVLIDNNQGNRKTFKPKYFSSFDVDTEFCSDRNGPEVLLYAKGIFEGYSGMELPGVKMSYECFTQRCTLGVTKADEGRYRLRTKIPSGCTNPFIIAEKDGYLPARGQLVGDRLVLNMKKLKKLNFSVMKHPYYSADKILGDSEPLGEGESVTIWLTAKNESFEQYKDYSSQKNGTEIEFLEDNQVYTLDIVLVKDDDIVGGYRNENLAVLREDVMNKKKIIFHVFEYRPTPINEKEKMEMAGYMLDNTYQEELRPEFI